ncbi:MAG: hypothetical protein ABL921_03330 [Pirellula sp.]
MRKPNVPVEFSDPNRDDFANELFAKYSEIVASIIRRRQSRLSGYILDLEQIQNDVLDSFIDEIWTQRGGGLTPEHQLAICSITVTLESGKMQESIQSVARIIW